MVHVDTQNRTEIGVDKAWTLTGTFDPGAGAKSVLFLKTKKNSGYEWNFPSLPAGPETTLSHVRRRSVLYTFFFSKKMFYE